VAGNAFECTGAWPSDLTPCAYHWPSSPKTLALTSANDLDVVELGLGRSPLPVDGGASGAVIDLRFFGTGVERHIHSASARAVTTAAGLHGPTEISVATHGWVEPVVVGDTPDQRNAGRFWLDFGWGTLGGTYDTAPTP
jgi:hypothetical protein